MYRINSVSKQLVRLLVVENGKEHLVNLLPKNFVFSDVHTDQMKVLENDGVIKVREVSKHAPVSRAVNTPAAKSTVTNKEQEKPVSGGIDMVTSSVEAIDVADPDEDKAAKAKSNNKKK